MSHSLPAAKTHRVYLLLRERIAQGRVGADGRLPGEEALAVEYAVSRVTIRRAIDGLVADGLVDKRAGAGTFVRAGRRRLQDSGGDLANVLAGLRQMGRQTGVRVLDFAYVPATPDVAAALRLAEGDTVQRTVRVRLLDGVPFSYLVAHVPERIGRLYDRADLEREPLLDLMERSGLEAVAAAQEIGAALAPPDVAAELGIETGAALVTLTRIVRDGEGRGMELLEARYRPELYGFRIDLLRGGDATRGRFWAPRPSAESGSAKANQTHRQARGNAADELSRQTGRRPRGCGARHL